jgi:hypothetical protein
MAAGRDRQARGRFVFALAAAPFVERLGLGLLSRGDQEEGRGAARHLATGGEAPACVSGRVARGSSGELGGTGCDPLSRMELDAAGYGVGWGRRRGVRARRVCGRKGRASAIKTKKTRSAAPRQNAHWWLCARWFVTGSRVGCGREGAGRRGGDLPHLMRALLGSGWDEGDGVLRRSPPRRGGAARGSRRPDR